MQRFRSLFGQQKCTTIGMIHLGANPGTPKYNGNFEEVVEKACYEADIYKKHNLDAVLIENMHDIPYVQNEKLGPEIIACMTRIGMEIRKILPKKPCGIQVLACGNNQAISIAKACNLNFIRTEGFVFGHVADEGYTNACAGELLRFRRFVDAENVLIFTDIKKKHSSHSITKDTSLLETAKASEFFITDGIILTGSSTGNATNLNDLNEVSGKVNVPIIIGSGVTTENLKDYFNKSDAVIVGSYFKKDGYWENDLCENRIDKFMTEIKELRM